MKINLGFWLLATSMITGCAKLDSSRLHDATNSDLKIYFGAEEGQSRIIAVSSSSYQQSAKVCVFVDKSCDMNQTYQLLAVSPTANAQGRYIFVSAIIPSSVRGDLLFSIGSEERRVRFDYKHSQGTSSWKSLFIAGDYQDDGIALRAWDNARRDIASLLEQRGFNMKNARHLSRDPALASEVYGATESKRIESALQDLQIGDRDSCFMFMTSHGSKQEFYIEGARGISPTRFGELLDGNCGNRPTVAIVSACYAGIMLTSQAKTPNRVIFTAADATHTSNGCDASQEYTFFDDCIIAGLKNTQIKTWKELGASTKECIARKENASNASYPQFYFGSAVADLQI